jgi:hypothetical protein
MPKGNKSADDLFSAIDSFGTTPKKSNAGSASSDLMDQIDSFDGGPSPAPQPSLNQKLGNVAQMIGGAPKGFDEQHPILSKVFDSMHIWDRTPAQLPQQVNSALSDIGTQITTPVDDVVKPSGDKVADTLAKANESVKRAGRVAKDIGTTVFSPISALLSPLNPEIEKASTAVQNIAKLTAPGATVKPEAMNNPIQGLITPGSVTTGDENADAVIDEAAPAAAMAVVGDLAKPGVKPGTIPAETLDAIRQSKGSVASEGHPGAETLKNRPAPTPEAQRDANAAYSASKPVNLPYELKDETGPALIEGEPARTPLVQKPEGPPTFKEIFGESQPEQTGETPAAKATRELEDQKRGFSVEDKRRVQPEAAAPKRESNPDLSRPAVPADEQKSLVSGEGKPVDIKTPQEGSAQLQPGDSVPPQLLASDAGKTLRSNLTRRGLDFDENGKVFSVAHPDADLETIRKASAESPDVAGKHVGYATDGKPVFDFNQPKEVAEPVKPEENRSAAGPEATSKVAEEGSNPSTPAKVPTSADEIRSRLNGKGNLVGRARSRNLPTFAASLKPDDLAAIQNLGMKPDEFWQAVRKRPTTQIATSVEGAKQEVAPVAAAVEEPKPEVKPQAEAPKMAEAGTVHEPPKYTGEQGVAVTDGARLTGLDGKSTNVRIPGKDEPVAAKYRAVELDSLTPSHSGVTFAPNDEFPVKNDRQYHVDKAEQQKVIANAQKYDPSHTINTNPTSETGPSIVTPGGKVLGGNSRVMTLQRLYGSNGDANAYKSYLAENASTFGIDPEQVKGMRRPVLVREVEAPKTVGETERAITEYNRSSTAALNPTARAVALGKKLTETSVRDIAGMLDDLSAANQSASVADLLRERPQKVLDILRRDGALSENEINGFVEQSDKGLKFTDAGKEIVGDALLGHWLGDADLVSRMAPSLKGKLEAVLSEGLQLKARGEDPWNLTNVVKQAVDDLRQAAGSGMPLDDYYKQGGMFDASANPVVEAMAKKLTETQKAIKTSFRQFLGDAKMDVPGQGMLGMIEKPAPNQAFADGFGGQVLKPEQYSDSHSRAWVERNGGPPSDTTFGAGLLPVQGLANLGKKIAGSGPQQIPVTSTKLSDIQKVQEAPRQSFQFSAQALKDAGKEFQRRYYDKFVDWRDLTKQLNRNGVQLLPLENPDNVLDIVYGSTGAKLQKQAILMKRIVRDAAAEGLRDNLQGYLNLKGYQRAYDVLNEKLSTLRQEASQLEGERASGKAALKAGTKSPIGDAKDLAGAVDRLADVKEQIKEIEERISNGQVVPRYKSESEIQADISNLRQSLGPGKFAQVQLHADRVFDMNREAWDEAHKSGIISDEVYQQGVNRGKEYIPLERIMQDVDVSQKAMRAGLDLKTQKILRKLEGSELVNVDPFSASLNRIFETTREVERNKAAKVAVGALQKMNQFQPDTVTELKNGASVPHDKGVIGYYEGGEPKRFAAPKMLADSLALADATQRSATAHVILSTTRKLFRTGATGANVFWSIFNVVKDQADAFQLAKLGMKTPLDAVKFERDWFKNAYNVFRENDKYLDQLDNGFLASTMQKAIDPQHFLKLKSDGVVGRIGDLTIGKVEELNNALEEATKLTVYQRLINKGWDPTEAAIETRRFGGSPDFARSGYDRSLDLAVMFLNANVQGLTRAIGRGFGVKAHPVVFGAMTAGLLGLMANNMSYTRPDGSREYDHITDIDKQNYWNIILPYTYQTTQGEVKHGVWKIPKGHTAQLIFNPMEELIHQAMAKKADPEGLALDTVNSFLPGAINLQKGKLASSFSRGVVGSLNPILKVPAEELGNMNTLTGGAIVPARMENIAPTEQFRDTTSPTARKLGKLINDIPGVENSPILRNFASPLRIEHALRGTLAGIGDQVLGLFDAAQSRPKSSSLMEADEKVAHLPIVSGFTRRMVGSTQDQEIRDKEETFYDVAGQAREALATFNSISGQDSARAKDWITADPRRLVLASLSGHLEEQSKLLSKIRKASESIANNDTLPMDQRKAALAKLFDAREQVLKQNDQVDELIDQVATKIKERKVKALPAVAAKGE